VVTYPDLLYGIASQRVDARLLERALIFGFSAGDTDRAFERCVESARVPESTFDGRNFASDLFIAELVRQCFKLRIEGKVHTPCASYLERVISRPPAKLEDVVLRQRVFEELLDKPALKRHLEAVYVAVLGLRELLSRGDFSARVDQNQRRLEILRAVVTLFRRLQSFDGATSVLARLSNYSAEVVAAEGFRFAEELLRYEDNHASVNVSLQLGSDGTIRQFEVTDVRDTLGSPLQRSLFARFWRQLLLVFKGYRVTESEVLSRLLYRAFEGLKEFVPPLFQMLGDIEVYLCGLGFWQVGTGARHAMCFAEFSASDAHSATSTPKDASETQTISDIFNPFLVVEGAHVQTCDVDCPRGTIVILTGPNSGGKTRLMQAVALVNLLGHGGFPVPARRATLTKVDNLFVSMIEEVRADQAEGRLGMELLRIRKLFEQVRPGDLVILDELCSGTNPSEGEEIFQLVTELLAQLGPQVWISTHFLKLAHQLQSQRAAHPYLRFLQVELDADEHPTYSFRPGVAATSLARQTAARLGVTRAELSTLVERAKTGVRAPW
jgi:DNA mismatch repair protein MutS2